MQQSCITSFHVICQCMVLHHDRESIDWLMGMRLSTTSWVVFGSYLVVAGAIGFPLLIYLVVVFSHVTLMPWRNLDSRVRCSHMIELLGARWCLGMCDVTHCNLLLCNLTSVLTSDPLLKCIGLMSFNCGKIGTVCALQYVHHQLSICASCLCISYMHTSRTSSSLHHDVCIIGPASRQMHHVTYTISFAWRSSSLHCIGPAIIPLTSLSLSWLMSKCIMSLNILSLFLSIVTFHWHKNHILWLAKSWARMFQTLL